MNKESKEYDKAVDSLKIKNNIRQKSASKSMIKLDSLQRIPEDRAE